MEQYALYCNDIYVGLINEPFDNDETWYGMFEQANLRPDIALEKHILEFILFFKQYNQAMEDGEDQDESGFDNFRDLMEDEVWIVRDKEKVYKVDKAPNFYDDEISWRLKEECNEAGH